MHENCLLPPPRNLSYQKTIQFLPLAQRSMGTREMDVLRSSGQVTWALGAPMFSLRGHHLWLQMPSTHQQPSSLDPSQASLLHSGLTTTTLPDL